jgi:fibronectin-binding autotransporter adhesin
MTATRWWGLTAALMVALAGSAAEAATCTWQATVAGQNFNGSTANWSCGRTPLATDDVVFDGGSSSQSCGFTSTITIQSVTFQNAYSQTVTGSASGLTVNGNWTMPTGTFTGGGGGVTISGSLSVSGTASFTGSGSTTQIGGSLTNSAAFSANGGLVKLTSTSVATLTSGGATLAALTVNGSGGTYTLQDTLTTTGTVTVTAGTLTAGAKTVTIGGGLTINGGTFNASSGTTSIAGAFNRSSGTFNANGGTVYLNGTSTLSHTFGGSQLANVQVGLGTNGLVADWSLDDAAGTTAIDSSGSGDNGTWSGSGVSRNTSVSSKISFADPRGITLDGSNGYVSLGVTNLPANNAVQTISLWFQGNPNGGNENMIAMSNLTTGSALQLGFRGASLIAWNYGGGTLVSTTAPVDGLWHQVIYTYDGTNDTLYLDGVQSATAVGSHQTGTPTSAYLGTYSPTAELFVGSLDDVRVYNRVITSAEIAILGGGGSPSIVAGTHTFSDAFSCTGNFSLLAGTVAGSATLSVGGNWFNGGTFSNTGQVTMTGTSASGTITSGGSAFGALTVNGTGGTYRLVDALSTTRDFKITAGTVTGTQPVTCGGSWSNSGVFSDTGAVTLTSTVATKTILSGGSRFSGGLTINGVGGTYTISDRLWVPGGTITLTNGTLNGGTSTMHVGAFSVGSGSFAAGTGTVVFDGTTSQSLPSFTFSGLRLEDPLEANLVGYWKLDEGQGTTLQDVSGNGNSGAMSSSGVTWQTGGASVPATVSFDDNAALSFNGTSGYAQLGATNIPATNAAVTISTWVNFTSVSGNQNMVVLAGGGNYLQFGIRGGVFTVWPSGAGTTVTGAAAVVGSWHHVAYTYDGTSVDTIYVDGVAYTGSFTHQSGTTTAVYLGTFSPSSELLAGALDDVRIYNVALTASQVAQLAAGRYAGTGGYATTTLSANTTVSGLLALDASVLNANGKTMSASSTTTAAQVNCGTYTVSNAAQTFSGGLTVQPPGALTLASSGGSVQIGSGKTLTIDGTLNASNASATIQGVAAASYTFKVGSTSSVTPIVNVSALAVKNTSGGMQIGATTSSTTTFTKFDNVAFSGGTGAQYLLLNAKTVFLSSSGCTFDSGIATGATTKAVTAVGDGTGNGETRAVFGGTKCATNWALSASDTVCVAAAKSDDDSDGNGIADSGTSATNGAIVQFTRAAQDDTAGSIIGFPTAAFNWSTFTYYSTYAAFHNASAGTSDVVYVRDESGNPLYSWTVPTAGETITGTPQWNMIGGTHYLFVATSAGKVYKLIDTATGTPAGTLTLDTVSTGWSTTNPYNCGCTISTPLGLDATNLYWGSTTSGKNFWTLGQSNQSTVTPVTLTQAVTNTGISVATIGSTPYAFMGVTGSVLAITSNAVAATNNSPGTQSVFGRIVVGLGATKRVYAGDDGGTMWAIDPTTTTTFATANGLWKYNTANAIKSAPYYDLGTDTVQYGTQGGTIIVLNGSGVVLNAGYPYLLPGGATDAITAAPLFYNGVLVVGTTKGKLYFLDRNTGASVSIIREYDFGPTESVSGVGFDPTVNRYMVTTANGSTNDGRLYYFDLLTDPTIGSL